MTDTSRAAPPRRRSPPPAGPVARPTGRRSRWPPARDAGAAVVVLLAVGVAWLVGALGAPLGVRAPVTLLFACVVPGWSVVRLLRLRDPLAGAVWAVGLSVSAQILVATAMLAARAWHPEAAWVGTLVVPAAVTLASVVPRPRRGTGGASRPAPTPRRPSPR